MRIWSKRRIGECAEWKSSTLEPRTVKTDKLRGFRENQLRKSSRAASHLPSERSTTFAGRRAPFDARCPFWCPFGWTCHVMD